MFTQEFFERFSSEFEKSRRMEVKFALPQSDFFEFDVLQLGLFGSLKETFPQRRVNSIYWDSKNFDSAQDNFDGISKRIKIRHRWYGKNQPKKCILEFKFKWNKLGFKLSYDQSKTLPYKNTFEELRKQRAKKCPMMLHPWLDLYSQPTLSVHYDRRYFSSADNTIRATIDTNLNMFEQLSSQFFDKTKRIPLPELTIIEMKFSPDKWAAARSLIDGFPIRPSKCSKYALGISHFNG